MCFLPNSETDSQPAAAPLPRIIVPHNYLMELAWCDLSLPNNLSRPCQVVARPCG